MKVAYFTHASNLTGANRSLVDLTISLKARGVVPYIFIPNEGPLVEELDKYGIKWYVVPYKPWYRDLTKKYTVKKRIKSLLKEIYNFYLAYKTAKFIKREQIDIVHSNSMIVGFGSQVASAAELPHVWHMREFMEEDHGLSFANKKLSISRMKHSAALIAISDVIAAKFSKKTGRNVEIIYNGVYIDKYKIENKRIFENQIIEIVIIGRITGTKGQMEAVEAINLLTERGYNVHLRIIGDGINNGEVERIQAYISENKLDNTVEMIPFQSDISSYSRASDIQLVCSHSEAFGRVTIEGMLSHALVIGADAGCTPYLISDGETGLLYVCKDPVALADKIEWAITHKEEAREIAEAGYRHGEIFSIEQTADKVFRLYEKILDKK